MEKRTFLPLITSDRNNNCLRYWKIKKNSEDKLNSHMKKSNGQSDHYGMPPEASKFFRCYDSITLLLRQSFLKHIKHWPAKVYLYVDPWIHLNSWNSWEIFKSRQNSLKCVWEGVDIYKVCKPAVCSFMERITHLQWFKYFANFVKVNILRNSLECLHMSVTPI